MVYRALDNLGVFRLWFGVQASAARRLIGEVKGRTAITKVSGHNDYAAMGCPGFRENGTGAMT